MKRKDIRSTVHSVSPIVEELLTYGAMESGLLLKTMNTSISGYDEEYVATLQERYGKNELSTIEHESLLVRLFNAFINPFTVVLLIIAGISIFTDIVLVTPAKRDFKTVIVVILMVTISGVLRFVQETRSNKAADQLKALVYTTVSVERQGRQEVSLSELVPGDIIYLAAGDMIPADIRVLACKDLFISQSALTGESEPVEKVDFFKGKVGNNPLELPTLAFMGSNVISGSATCIVLATGDNTCFGAIAKTVTTEKTITDFDKGINSVSWVLIRFMMLMVPIVFFINGFTKGDWLQAFLFALSVAVGLTPEMLPVIVTTNLAKGAVAMAKQKTVVKHLDAIQNFGAMDVLCTDKTGTITQDRVVLEYHLDIHGNEDARVLRHAFLNSFFQTGLKSLMDVAILAHADQEPYHSLEQRYEKVDEIPFDFNRRRMSVVIKDQEGKTQLITKGAIEEMLAISTFAEYNGKVEPLSQTIKEEILQTVEKLNYEGMRVIAVAQKTNPAVEVVFSIKDESAMVLMGYLAFLDPPKPTTAAALKALNEYGVTVKVLTGDNDAVTKCICQQVGMPVEQLLLGSEVEAMCDQELAIAVETTNVFAKLSPQQKARIVRVLRNNNHVVGFMGDGINDAAAMKVADVGISVDTAVDIAKESADIILLEKDLMVLEEGIIGGRRTFGNIIKYVKMTASSNFGNMLSVVVASAFLPFLPMLPVQIILLNLIYDLSCTSIPWDNMDNEYLKVPRRWNAGSISKFMLWIGPTSSVFDITTYLIMFFIICPLVTGAGYWAPGTDQILFAAAFNAGWFIESLWSQTLVIHMIRTEKLPFIQSRASKTVIMFTTIAMIFGTIIPFTTFGHSLKMHPLPLIYFAYLVGVIVSYMLLATFMKTMYRRRFGELL